MYQKQREKKNKFENKFASSPYDLDLQWLFKWASNYLKTTLSDMSTVCEAAFPPHSLSLGPAKHTKGEN